MPEGVDLRQEPQSLPVSANIGPRVVVIPWFKHYRPEVIEQYAEAVKKVAANYKALLPGDTEKENLSGWSATAMMAKDG